jgi:hypothetical protein
MLQLSKILKSRDEWRDKAKQRAKEIWEMRKAPHTPAVESPLLYLKTMTI